MLRASVNLVSEAIHILDAGQNVSQTPTVHLHVLALDRTVVIRVRAHAAWEPTAKLSTIFRCVLVRQELAETLLKDVMLLNQVSEGSI